MFFHVVNMRSSCGKWPRQGWVQKVSFLGNNVVAPGLTIEIVMLGTVFQQKTSKIHWCRPRVIFAVGFSNYSNM